MNRPAFKTFLFFSAGILLSKYVHTSPALGLFLTGLLIILASYFLFNKGKNYSGISYLLIAAIILAGYSFSNIKTNYIPVTDISNFADSGSKIVLKAHLIKYPVHYDKKTRLYAECETITTRDTTIKCSGKILITAYRNVPSSLQYGDQFITELSIILPDKRRNPGGFDYRAFLASKNIFAIGKSVKYIKKTKENSGSLINRSIVYPVKRFVRKSLESHIEKPALPLALAFLTGERGLIQDQIIENFKYSGALHILAVSGLHLGFVLLFLEMLFSMFRIPVKVRIVLEIAGLFLFTLITEIRASILRAFVMAALFLLGKLLKKRPDPLNIIGVAGIILLLIQPLWLFDTGFILSFSAVFSIIYFYPGLKKAVIRFSLYPRDKILKSIIDLTIVSVAAQIGTLPVTFRVFNTIPVLSPVVNLIAIPAAGFIVSLGLLTVIFSLFSGFIAGIYGLCTSFIIYFINWFTSVFAAVPFSRIQVPSLSFGIVVIYILTVFTLFSGKKKTRKYLVFAVLILSNTLVWSTALTGSFSRLKWIQFDVGQGDAALIMFPRKKTMLIDGGNNNGRFDNGKNVIAPFLLKNGIRKIDAVIATHAHNDHIGGLVYILNNFSVGRLYCNGVDFDSKLNRQLSRVIKNRKIPVSVVTAVDSITGFPGAKIYLLSPDSLDKKRFKNDINNTSVVTEICFGNNRFLFMGDAEFPVENNLIRKNLSFKSDIIKVGHHGSAKSCSVEFLKHIRPEFAVISVGRKNVYKHPSPYCIERLKNSNVSIIRTDYSGAVIIKSDGKNYSVINN